MTKCGTSPGKKATGTPIKLGAIATKQPGTDFTDIPNAEKAYFDYVNDNGGIKGHPIQYVIETEQTDPGQNASLARKLVESEKVVGIVGGLSLIECAVNHKYYEQKGFYVIDAGIAPECYGTPNSAGVNMGPRYSSDGAVQYVLRQGAKKIVFDQSNVPGTGYIAEGPALLAKAAGVPIVQLKENVPIQDANSIAIKQVQAAGPDGAVVLNFTPPEALKILQAAQRQGLQNRVKAWGCSTPCNFVAAEITVSALQTISGDYTVQSVNQAIKNVKDFKTDILCKPWYYGDAPLHIPNNTDWTSTPKNGKMVIKEQCFGISDVDPAIAQVRKLEKAGA